MKFGQVVSCKDSKSVLIMFLFLEFSIIFWPLCAKKEIFGQFLPKRD